VPSSKDHSPSMVMTHRRRRRDCAESEMGFHVVDRWVHGHFRLQIRRGWQVDYLCLLALAVLRKFCVSIHRSKLLEMMYRTADEMKLSNLLNDEAMQLGSKETFETY
jgi:hypothetical protein